LGVDYENTSFKHPVTGNPVFCFADPPHLIKLFRNNLLDHGFQLKDGTEIRKEDFVELLYVDNSEFRVCYKLTSRHLEVTGAERMEVRTAFQTISSTVASAFGKYFPEKDKLAAFIQLANDAFDILNSRIRDDKNPMKCSFGLHLQTQTQVLDRFYEEILHMKMIGAKNQALFPFQKGILMCINSLKNMYEYLHNSSLRVKYINVNRINQDVAENGFSIIRSIGGFKHTPNAVDAKYRLRMLCLTWHLLLPKSSAAVMRADSSDEDIVLFSSKITPLMLDEKTNVTAIPDELEEQLAECNNEIAEISRETWTEYNENLTTEQQCELGGEEFIAGYILSKLKSYFPELILEDEEDRAPSSWVQDISKGSLVIPSYKMLQLLKEWNKYFFTFHFNWGGKWRYNNCYGVIDLLQKRIAAKYTNTMKTSLEIHKNSDILAC